MIEIYRKTYHGKDQCFVVYDTFDELFQLFWVDEKALKCFGYRPTDRTTSSYLFGDGGVDSRFGWIAYSSNRFCYVAYEDGKFVTPDRLVGFYRAYIKARNKTYWNRWHHGRKKSAYGGYNSASAMAEKRQIAAADVDGYGIKVRAKRNKVHLPDPWDDYHQHNDKCWKTQSKRKKQYKTKTSSEV